MRIRWYSSGVAVSGLVLSVSGLRLDAGLVRSACGCLPRRRPVDGDPACREPSNLISRRHWIGFRLTPEAGFRLAPG